MSDKVTKKRKLSQKIIFLQLSLALACTTNFSYRLMVILRKSGTFFLNKICALFSTYFFSVEILLGLVIQNYVHYFLRVFAVESLLGGCCYPTENSLNIKADVVSCQYNSVTCCEQIFPPTQKLLDRCN